MALGMKWPPLGPGTPVKTTAPNENLRGEWTEEVWEAKRSGARGVIIKHSDSHGICYQIRHSDGTTAWYDPSEFLVEEQVDVFEDLMVALESYADAKAAYNKAKEGCRDSYFLSREAEARDRAKKQVKDALDDYIRSFLAMKALSP